jgi:hypothetical protein
MNVYEMICSCESANASRQIFADAGRSGPTTKEDDKWLDELHEFGGKPFSREWRPITLYIGKARLPEPDLLCAFPIVRLPVCNERAMTVLGKLMKACGELLPVRVAKKKGKFHLLNVTRMLPKVLHHKESTWRQIDRDFKLLKQPVFFGDRLPRDVSLFKIPEFAQKTYCLERTGKPEGNEFKALVEKHGLTGLVFHLVWTDEKALPARPVPKPSRKESPAPNPSDRPLNDTEQRDISLSIKRGYKYLKLEPKSSPTATQKAMLKAIDAIALGKKKVSKNVEMDLAVNLGCLWGQTVCDDIGWEWCCLMLEDRRETYVIVTPNRSHMVSPMDFVLRQLDKRLPEENTNLLLFNMLKGKSFGAAKAGSYMHVG